MTHSLLAQIEQEKQAIATDSKLQSENLAKLQSEKKSLDVESAQSEG